MTCSSSLLDMACSGRIRAKQWGHVHEMLNLQSEKPDVEPWSAQKKNICENVLTIHPVRARTVFVHGTGFVLLRPNYRFPVMATAASCAFDCFAFAHI